jgi:methionine-rich copper-binding protein CopC
MNNLTYKSINGVLYNKAGKILVVCPGGLTSISLPQGVTNIGDWAFHTCSRLTSISLPQGIKSIGDHAFDDCNNLKSISLPQEVTSIGKHAFYNCNKLTSINLPQGVTSIGKCAFHSCFSLTSISLPQGVTSIEQGTFFDCESLTSINLPQGITSIGENAFGDCKSLTSINLPQGVKSIGEGAFFDCESLTSINLPQGLESIGSVAFNWCDNLATIRFNSPTTVIYDNYDTIPGTTKIIGYDPSTAKNYAEKYDRTFEVISTTTPKVTSTDPVNNANNVPVNKAIKVTFRSNVQPGSTFSNITLKNAGGTTIATTNKISTNTNYLTIKPNANLTGNVKYTVNIPAGAVKDMSGTSLANTYNFSFTTALATPKVINYSPADNATRVAVNSKLVLTFDQNVSAVKGKNIYIKKTANDNQVGCIPVTDKNRVNISGAKVTINPSSNFRPNTGYYILIDSGAFKNSNNGLFAGINNKTIWNFTTIDTIPPAVSSTDPANNSTKVAVNKTIKVTFSENVLKGNTFGNITLKNISNGKTIKITTSIKDNVLTIQPNDNLKHNTKYKVTIPAGAIKNTAGSILAADYTFSFTTKKNKK